MKKLKVVAFPGKEQSAGDEVANGKEKQTRSHVEAEREGWSTKENF